MAFNNFLSTSDDHNVARAFAESSQDNSDLIGVPFVINIDPSIPSFPFANLRGVSYFREEEILFSMHSVFRIGQVKQIHENTRLWQADLTLTSDNDPQLHDLTKSMQYETSASTGWHRLGKLMIKLRHLNKAEELYNILFEQTTDEDAKARLYHQFGQIKGEQGNYTKAIKYYEKVHVIWQKILHANHLNLATSYNSIGLVYRNMGEYSKALSYSEKALQIRQEGLPAYHPSLATSYNNIGLVYRNMGEYSEALPYFERALDIWKRSLPSNHSSIVNVIKSIDIVKLKL